MPSSPLKKFLVRFALVYALLLLPWPGFDDAYSAYFRAFGSMVFAGTERTEITFETATDLPRKNLTRLEIVNKALMNYDGSGPLRQLDLSAVSVGWRPLALFLALTVATPLPWCRRIRALIWGTIGLHLALLLFLGVSILDESTEISLVTLTPFWKAALSGFKMVLFSQIGFFLPVLIWGLVTFRGGDLKGPKACPRPATAPKLKPS